MQHLGFCSKSPSPRQHQSLAAHRICTTTRWSPQVEVNRESSETPKGEDESEEMLDSQMHFLVFEQGCQNHLQKAPCLQEFPFQAVNGIPVIPNGRLRGWKSIVPSGVFIKSLVEEKIMFLANLGAKPCISSNPNMVSCMLVMQLLSTSYHIKKKSKCFQIFPTKSQLHQNFKHCPCPRHIGWGLPWALVPSPLLRFPWPRGWCGRMHGMCWVRCQFFQWTHHKIHLYPIDAEIRDGSRRKMAEGPCTTCRIC